MDSGLLTPLTETVTERYRLETSTRLPRLIAEAGIAAAFAWDERISI
jgi:hypothetical protein